MALKDKLNEMNDEAVRAEKARDNHIQSEIKEMHAFDEKAKQKFKEEFEPKLKELFEQINALPTFEAKLGQSIEKVNYSGCSQASLSVRFNNRHKFQMDIVSDLHNKKITANIYDSKTVTQNRPANRPRSSESYELDDFDGDLIESIVEKEIAALK